MEYRGDLTGLIECCQSQRASDDKIYADLGSIS
jgi:hypothetical protein